MIDIRPRIAPAKLKLMLWMCALLLCLQPQQKQVVLLGVRQSVHTRIPLAGMHTRFTEEAEEWKIREGMKMIREMGVSWIVEFFPWAYYEPRKGVFDWHSAERVISHAEHNGLTIIARLGFVPEWARQTGALPLNQTTPTYLPQSAYDDFANYAAEFADHFRGRVGHIILWNEPNLSVEWGLQKVDAASYAELVKRAYEKIKRRNPDVQVLAGALAPTLEPTNSSYGLNDLIYLQQFYSAIRQGAGAKRYFDGLAVHSYGRTLPPNDPPSPKQINFRRTELLREIMLRNGDADLPIYITEAGWNDDVRWVFGVSPANRIRYTLEAWEYAQTNWSWVNIVAMWVFKEPRQTRSYRDRFTFVSSSLEPLPIYDEIRARLHVDE
jgi:hypothetical protein